MTKDQILDHLAKCGLLYSTAPIPEEEDGPILWWDGGCDAVVAVRDRNGTWVAAWDARELEPLYCWMRLPHPTIWPTTDKAPAIRSQSVLFNEYKGDVFSHPELTPADSTSPAAIG